MKLPTDLLLSHGELVTLRNAMYSNWVNFLDPINSGVDHIYKFQFSCAPRRYRIIRKLRRAKIPFKSITIMSTTGRKEYYLNIKARYSIKACKLFQVFN